MLKAIETVYKGYRFRSRLEARWAVFFDALGIEWEYEKEGYDLDGVRYLPDFFLCRRGIWVEIKPASYLPIQYEAVTKFSTLAVQSNHGVLVLAGDPYPQAYAGIYFDPGIYEGEALMTPAQFMGCRKCDGAWLEFDEGGFGAMSLNCEIGCQGWSVLDADWHPALKEAYSIARQARFEHGEKPNHSRRR